MRLAKENGWIFLTFILPYEKFCRIRFLSQCRVHWMNFQKMCTFTYQKILLHKLFFLFWKSSKTFSVSLTCSGCHEKWIRKTDCNIISWSSPEIILLSPGNVNDYVGNFIENMRTETETIKENLRTWVSSCAIWLIRLICLQNFTGTKVTGLHRFY